MKAPLRSFPPWALYLVLFLMLLTLIQSSDFSGIGWEGLRPNLVAEVVGILLAVGFVDVFLRLREKAKWHDVERLIRERLLSAMNGATGMVELALDVKYSSLDALTNATKPGLVSLFESHLELIDTHLHPKVEHIAHQWARPLYIAIAFDLKELMETLDTITGNHIQHLEPNETKQLLEAHRSAGYFRHQLEYCISLQKPFRGQKKGAIDDACKLVPEKASQFLHALLAAETTCVNEYRKTLNGTEK